MATLQKLDILSLGRLKTEAVTVEGADDIIISEMGAADSFVLFTDPKYQDGNGGFSLPLFAPAMLVRSIVDPDGNRIFGDDEEHVIARLPGRIFHTLVDAALRINGLSDAAHQATLKNSEPSTE